MNTEIAIIDQTSAGTSFKGINWPNLALHNFTSLKDCKTAQHVYEINARCATYRYYDGNGFMFIDGLQSPPLGMIEDCD